MNSYEFKMLVKSFMILYNKRTCLDVNETSDFMRLEGIIMSNLRYNTVYVFATKGIARLNEDKLYVLDVV
jgi:hypothetical protein